jgi:16S rRNA G966 N2-methylase RsmD
MFESHIAQAKEAGKELTSEGVYKLSKEHLRSLKIDQLKPVPDFDQLCGYIRISLIEGDFRNHSHSFEQVDAIIADPPYAKSVAHLYEDLARFAAQVLKPGGSLITMAGGVALPQIYESMSRHIDYHWTIAYYMPARLDRMYQEKVASAWKPILWFVKGKRDGVKYSGKWTIDVIKAGHIERGLHKWQQSESGIDKLIKVVTRPGDIVLDPFMGSGTFLAAALRLNRRIIGIEIDPVASKTAETRLYKLARRITNPHLY